MGESRIDTVLTRLNAAMQRFDASRERLSKASLKAVQTAQSEAERARNEKDQAGSARVMALVNTHEKLREEVADTLRDLDGLIEELES